VIHYPATENIEGFFLDLSSIPNAIRLDIPALKMVRQT